MSTPRFAVTQGIDHLRDNLGGAAASRTDKLNTFDGVFIPVALSIWGIIVYLRFGFIIGQVGLLGTVLLFSGGYLITSSTTLSISAICSNGLVKGGGAYYLISRSLGPEFGGSIGLLYSLATVLTGSMSVVGFVEPFLDSFGKDSGSLGNVFEESRPWRILYGTVLLAICGFISFLGSKLFAKASLVLAGILSVSTISVILSLLFRPPFSNDMVNLTGFSLETLYGNLYPSFTNEFGQEQSFRTIFAIIFPACTGILAGAAMSGDLKYPSKAIPKGTLGAVGFTFIAYMILAVVLAGSVDRKTLHENFGVLQDTAFYPGLVVIGVLSAAFFTALGAIVGAAKMLQAISKDGLLGVLTPFAYGRPKDNEPVTAIALILVLIEIMVLIADDINQIAPFVTMFCLLTFGITNLACFILRVTGAPNFRPSFHYFSWESALFGLVSCFSAMVYVDTLYSSISFIVFVSLFFAIHFFAPAKDDWGDVSQSIIYHQVRKYLLQLDSRKDHVKFWRPQILLLVNSPLKHYKLIKFNNHLKKGGLFVLGHTIVGEFDDVSPIFKKQVHSWLRFVDLLHLKAFVNVTIAKDERIGAQSLLMGSGLGGMRPNIVVLGFHKNNTPAISEPSKSTSITTLSEQTSDDEHSGSIFTDPPIDTTPFDPSKFYYDHSLSDTDIDLLNTLPLDQSKISSESYVGIIEDAIKLEKAVAVMRGLERLEWFTGEKIKDDGKGRSGSVYSGSEGEGEPLLPKYVVSGVKKQKFIDLWPIQIHDEMHPEAAFDTYTLVLQMGCILHMQHQFQNTQLRVMAFVEKEESAAEEKHRVEMLLRGLRIDVVVKMVWLISKDGKVESEEFKLAREPVKKPSPRPKKRNSVMRSTRLPHTKIHNLDPHLYSPKSVSKTRSHSSLTTARNRRSMFGKMFLVEEEETDFTNPEYSSDDFSSVGANEVVLNMPKVSRTESSPAQFFTEPESFPVLDRQSIYDPINGSSSSSNSNSNANGIRSDTLVNEDLTDVNFDSLSQHRQHLIINELMRIYSKDASMVFTSLPAPQGMTCVEEGGAKLYLELLDLLTKDLPPVVLVHGKGLTVTMHL